MGSTELTHEELQELLGAYALDAVEEHERDALDAHLATCASCRTEVGEHLEVAAMLGGAGAPAPSGVWDRLVEAIEDDVPRLDLSRSAPSPRRSWGSRVAAGLAVAAMALSALLGLRVLQLEDRIQPDGDRLAAAATAAAADPRARWVVLSSEDREHEVGAVVMPDGTGYLLRDNLDPLADTRTYQLWALVGENTISAGVLGNDPEITAFHVDPTTGGLAITEEEAGGAITPQNPPVVFGEITEL